MALWQANHVTSASGVTVWNGDDSVDGWPVAPLKLAQKTTFFTAYHGNSMLRLFYKAQSAANWVTGAQPGYASGTIPGYVSGGIGGSGAINLGPGVQTTWFRGGSGLPRRENQT